MFKKHTPSPTIYPEELELSVSWKIVQNFGTISLTNFFCSSAFKKINRDHTFRIYTVFLLGVFFGGGIIIGKPLLMV